MTSSKLKPVVVIHTNDQQMIPALASAHSLKSRSKSPERFDVRILRLEETPHLYRRNGQKFIWWDGDTPSVWRRRDLLSFRLLRRMVPALVGFNGRALVVDPDVFAIGDVYELLSRDMNGKAVLCRQKPEWRGGRRLYSSAVMLLDCHRLTSWNWERDIDEIFFRIRALGPWMSLFDMSSDDIGLFEDEWNHHDLLTEGTRLLHNTEILTQPWKTGLALVRYTQPRRDLASWRWWRATAGRKLAGIRGRTIKYQPHPDPRQEAVFFALLKECVEQGSVSEQALRIAMQRKYLRKDTLALLKKVPGGITPGAR